MANNGIYKDKKRGTWFIDVRKKLPNDTIVHLKKRGFRSKAEADSQYEFFLNEAIKNKGLKRPSIIFNDLIDQWIDYKSSLVKRSSIYGIKMTINKHIKVFFKNYSIDQALLSDNLKKFREYLQKQEFKSEWKNKIIKRFIEIIQYGYDRGYISPQLFKNAKIELINFSTAEEIKKSRKVLSKIEYESFLSTFNKNDKYLFLFEMLLFTGCRIGELCALQWKDIDFDKKIINVSKTASSHLGTGKIEVTSTKTRESERSIAMTVPFIKKLVSYKNSFLEIKDINFIFFNKRTPLNQNTIREVMNRHQKKANFKRHFSPHEFRHTNTTWLLDKCSTIEEIDIVRKRLGHSSLKTTLDIYYHSNPNRQREIANKINDILK